MTCAHQFRLPPWEIDALCERLCGGAGVGGSGGQVAARWRVAGGRRGDQVELDDRRRSPGATAAFAGAGQQGKQRMVITEATGAGESLKAGSNRSTSRLTLK